MIPWPRMKTSSFDRDKGKGDGDDGRGCCSLNCSL